MKTDAFIDNPQRISDSFQFGGWYYNSLIINYICILFRAIKANRSDNTLYPFIIKP